MKTITLIIITSFLRLSFDNTNPIVLEEIESFYKDSIFMNDDLCIADVSFEKDVKIILEQNCTLAGCHVTDAPMRGDFTSYETLMNYINSGGIFQKRLLVNKDMPPAYSPGKTSLSADELKIISCWIDQGFKP